MATESSAIGVLARRASRALVRCYYRRVEISGAERIPASGPVLLCANHANSLFDPVMVGIAGRRPVRFLAKEPLFETPILGRVMHALGMIPAFRGSDDASQVRRNLDSLAAAAKSLAEGEAVGIFPEGKSHDETAVEMIRSGAARMALQAVSAGASDLKLIPIGINYEDKARFQSTVWIRVGEPIDVPAWAAQHEGDGRAAARGLTIEIGQRLKHLILHLDEPHWAPFLEHLEALTSLSEPRPGKNALYRRKRIADALNYHLTADRARTAAIAQEIEEYREQVHQAGLTVGSPVLQQRGMPVFLRLLQTFAWLVLFFLPALLGSLFHIVPFLVVRAAARRLQTPGKTTVSLYRLLAGAPFYGLWYAVISLLMFGYFTPPFAASVLLFMPLAGLAALGYWRTARDAAKLFWHEIICLLRPSLLMHLRARRAALSLRLDRLAEEYRTAARAPEDAPFAIPQKRSARKTMFAAAIIAAVVIPSALYFLFPKPLLHAESGLALGELSTADLQRELNGDERSLTAVIQGLEELESRASVVQAGFAAGRRTLDNAEDDNAVRQLLLAYLNYRTALLRLLWKYQQHSDVADKRLRLRSFLLDFTAAAVLYAASSKFVYQFSRSPKTISRLNEGEPVWNIPAGLYDTVERNLNNVQNMRLMNSATAYYLRLERDFAESGLTAVSPYDAFHRAIAEARHVVQGSQGPGWQRAISFAAKELAHLARTVRYETQSVVSTWIGDTRIREPRSGRALIQPEQVDALKSLLQPGDIILERRNWYLSNAFLPDYWPHSAIYVGTADDLRRMGLDRDERVRRFWTEFSAGDASGHNYAIIEAVSEGVIFNTIEHSIGGGDSAAVLRPRVTAAEIKEAIARAFSHIEKPYDFEFDFATRDKLVCTEVVFRAYGENHAGLQFPLKVILGRQTMPAIELVRKFAEGLQHGETTLDFVAFLDGDETTGTAVFRHDPEHFVRTLERPALTLLQK